MVVSLVSRLQTARDVLEQLRPFYAKANIPTFRDKRACEKMVSLLDENKQLRCILLKRRSTKASGVGCNAEETGCHDSIVGPKR